MMTKWTTLVMQGKSILLEVTLKRETEELGIQLTELPKVYYRDNISISDNCMPKLPKIYYSAKISISRSRIRHQEHSNCKGALEVHVFWIETLLADMRLFQMMCQ